MSTPIPVAAIIEDLFTPMIAASPSDAQPGEVVGLLAGVTLNFERFYVSLGSVPLLGSGTVSTEDIVWSMGSNTKVFTATLLALAAQLQENNVSLTTSVQSLLPSSVPINYYEKSSTYPILLWHLATHSAGWPDGLCPKAEGNYTFDQMSSFLSAFTPQYAPGQYYNYSNQGFALLGALMSHVFSEASQPQDWDSSYEDWTSLLTSNVLSPLGMNSTVVDILSVENSMAVPYLYKSTGQPYQTTTPSTWQPDSAGLGAGALSTTLADMLTFLEAQIAPPGGNLGSAIQMTQAAPCGSDLSMGLGWGLGDSFLCKDGQVSGYTSFMTVDTGAQLGVVVVANTLPSDNGRLLALTTLGALGAIRGTDAPVPHYPQTKLSLDCP
jgi:CubicO group peptidase (beta-lactamase class C family)